MKQLLAISLLTVLGVVLVANSTTRTAQAQSAPNACSVQSLRGAYSFSGNGFFLNGAGLSVASNVGRFMADGSGSVSGTETFGNNGAIIRGVNFTGAYTVSPDCTGTISFAPTASTSAGSIDFVITANGTMLQFMDTDAGFQVTGTAYQMGGVRVDPVIVSE